MNRLRMMLVGAALITGGSALASAQVVQQDVAFRDHDRDRDREIETGTTIATEIAATTTTGFIGITTEMTDATWIATGAMTAVTTATTTGAGTGIAGSTGMAATGFTKNRR